MFVAIASPDELLPSVIVTALIIVALLVGAYYFLVVHKETYYTKIDNTKIEEIKIVMNIE